MHIMLDLETLSLQNNAVVSEAAIAIFDPQADFINFSYSWLLQLETQQKNGRHVGMDTVQWWLMQEEAPRLKMAEKKDRVFVTDFLDHLDRVCDWKNVEGFWSHGLNFDVIILTDMYTMYGRKVPWHYRTPRDTRTLFWLADMKTEDLVKAEVKHSAVSDAIAQAKSVQMAMRRLAVKNNT